MTTKTKSKRRVFNPKSLRQHPVVQAAATLVLARWQMFDEDGGVAEPEDDSVPQVAWEVYFRAMGIPEGDPREFDVNEAITDVALEMRDTLIKRDLLQKDCALKLQVRRAA